VLLLAPGLLIQYAGASFGAATLAFAAAVVVGNVPHLNDVTTMVELLARMGVTVTSSPSGS
jgi:UDP-N-acetylglucosamine enolpyruvyl transferase